MFFSCIFARMKIHRYVCRYVDTYVRTLVLMYLGVFVIHYSIIE